MKKEIEKKDELIQHFVSDLREIEKQLIIYVEDGKKQIQRMENAEQNPLLAEDVVSYAHRISYVTGPNWRSQREMMEVNPIVLGFQPPAPQEAEIRSGTLYTNPKSSLLDFIKK